jgi:hypothetical protein
VQATARRSDVPLPLESLKSLTPAINFKTWAFFVALQQVFNEIERKDKASVKEKVIKRVCHVSPSCPPRIINICSLQTTDFSSAAFEFPNWSWIYAKAIFIAQASTWTRLRVFFLISMQHSFPGWCQVCSSGRRSANIPDVGLFDFPARSGYWLFRIAAG